MIKKKYNLKDIAKVKKDYKIFDYLIYTKISRYITLVLLHTKITPNQVTLLSLIFAIVSSIFFLQGTYTNIVFGAIFLQLGHIFDCVDGEIARVKKITSEIGGFFDSTVNVITYYLVIPSMAIGHYLLYDDSLVLIFAIFALGNIFLISELKLMFQSKVKNKKLGHLVPINKKLIIGGFNTYAFILGLGAILNIIPFILGFIAIIGTIIWIKQIYSYYKICKS